MYLGHIISCFLCARYNVTPNNLQKKCDGFYQYFYVCHGLICTTEGLVIAFHKDLHDNILYLTRQASPPTM